ncbi:hypothetical protein [Streptomyces sp. NPDC002537]
MTWADDCLGVGRKGLFPIVFPAQIFEVGTEKTAVSEPFPWLFSVSSRDISLLISAAFLSAARKKFAAGFVRVA